LSAGPEADLVLIFTHKGDIHCNPVIDHLVAIGQPVMRVNTEALMVDYEVSWSCSADGGTELFLRCHRNGIEARAAQVRSVWERRPHAPQFLPGDASEERLVGEARKVALEEAGALSRWVRHYLIDRFWIGSPIWDRIAESKTLQLRVAGQVVRELGLARHLAFVDTVIANRAAPFAAGLPASGQLAIKPLEADGASLEQIELPFLTQRLDAEELHGLPPEAFESAPVHAQVYVEKAWEARITVVVDEVFGCRIDSTRMEDARGGVDWRAGYEGGIPQSVFEVPEPIRQFCVAYLSAMKLHFGCFDFIVDHDGVYRFLECNPNGQWLWIEEDIGLPISEAIARRLALGG